MRTLHPRHGPCAYAKVDAKADSRDRTTHRRTDNADVPGDG